MNDSFLPPGATGVPERGVSAAPLRGEAVWYHTALEDKCKSRT
ncbi:MAG TPA: hypothetical protein VM492_00185 [Sumerlaeia bacterium]|nr:hypothetical protein [Sumerlaeia bacterium]